MNNKSTLRLVSMAIFTAIVFVTTFIVKIPAINGYVHLGDGFILTIAYLFGFPAVIASALGSALCDVLSGYVPYVLPTLLIKGLMAYIVVLFKNKNKYLLLSFVVAELCMVALYFIFEIFMYGVATAAGGIIPNLVQGATGIISAFILSKALVKLNLPFIENFNK